MGILWGNSFGVFLLVDIILGCGAAWMTGRAVAKSWRPLVTLIAYTALLAFAVRFLDYALFGGELLSPQYWVVAFVLLLATSLAAWRFTRAGQMTRQYRWLYERSGPFGWRDRTAPPA